MKIIFLDIDGVLTVPNDYYRGDPTNWHYIRVELIRKLLRNTGAKIVVSSSWRWEHHWDDLLDIFEDNGISDDYIYDYTDIVTFGERCDEIKNWLDENDHLIDSFVILDDTAVAGRGFEDNLVLTNSEYGMTITDYEKAIKILNSK